LDATVINNNISNSIIRFINKEHRVEYDHEFDWENPKILNIEQHYHKRLISEMMNIKTQRRP